MRRRGEEQRAAEQHASRLSASGFSFSTVGREWTHSGCALFPQPSFPTFLNNRIFVAWSLGFDLASILSLDTTCTLYTIAAPNNPFHPPSPPSHQPCSRFRHVGH